MIGLSFGLMRTTSSLPPLASPTPPVDVVKEEPLVGGNSENMVMQVVTLGPNAASPWHIHPDGHEISYVLEGAVKVEIDKQGGHVYKAGEGFHINANVVHRGVGEASGGKLLVVRIKPKDKPIMQPVTPTN